MRCTAAASLSIRRTRSADTVSRSSARCRASQVARTPAVVRPSAAASSNSSVVCRRSVSSRAPSVRPSTRAASPPSAPASSRTADGPALTQHVGPSAQRLRVLRRHGVAAAVEILGGAAEERGQGRRPDEGRSVRLAPSPRAGSARTVRPACRGPSRSRRAPWRRLAARAPPPRRTASTGRPPGPRRGVAAAAGRRTSRPRPAAGPRRRRGPRRRPPAAARSGALRRRGRRATRGRRTRSRNGSGWGAPAEAGARPGCGDRPDEDLRVTELGAPEQRGEPVDEGGVAAVVRRRAWRAGSRCGRPRGR